MGGGWKNGLPEAIWCPKPKKHGECSDRWRLNRMPKETSVALAYLKKGAALPISIGLFAVKEKKKGTDQFGCGCI